MNLLNNYVSRLFAFFYVILRAIFKKSKQVDNGHVLIIQWGNMGDALIDAKSILSLTEYYKVEGKKVTIAGKNEVKIALVNVLGMHVIDFVPIENGHLTIKSVKKILSGLEKDGYEVIISLLPWSNWPSLYIPACLPCNESWGVFPAHGGRIFKRILSIAYTNKITVSADMHQTQRNKLLIRKIGISNFQTEIIAIPSKNEMLSHTNDYILLSVDSKNTARRWVDENFIKLADCLLERYPYDIYLTGVNVEPDVLVRYERSFAGNDRVKIVIGKLCIDEWVETISGSQFVVSLDSGAAHIAASAGVTCFCLTGVWDGHRIMPYAVDKLSPDTKEPICVYRTDVDVEDLACYACFEKRRFGWGNKECSAQCRSGRPCLCLSKLSVDDVMSAIEKAECDGVIC